MTNEQIGKSQIPMTKPQIQPRRGFVYFGEERSVEQVADLVAAVSRAGVAYWLSYRADRPHFWYQDLDDEEQQVALWPAGRVFGSGLEVRWERQGESYAVWVLTEDKRHLQGLAEAGFRAVEGPWTAVETRRSPTFLWGRYDRGRQAWVEVQIPQAQPYPATPPAVDEEDTEKLFARLHVVYYRANNGAVQFTRLKGVR